MKNELLYDKKIFTPEFLMKLRVFGKSTSSAILSIAGAWGGCRIVEAEVALADLRETLMRLKVGNEYPSDYKGDCTFEKDVDEIIENLRGVARSFTEA